MGKRCTTATMANQPRGRTRWTRRERNVPAFWPVAWVFWMDDWGYHRVKRNHRHPDRSPLREIHTKNSGPSISDRIAKFVDDFAPLVNAFANAKQAAQDATPKPGPDDPVWDDFCDKCATRVQNVARSWGGLCDGCKSQGE